MAKVLSTTCHHNTALMKGQDFLKLLYANIIILKNF